MSKIRVLSEETINKIAAGEVIENPASVVKELIENALDAEATEIQIEIRGGGQQLIRIADNGIGMSADDAVLCLERHATSKLARAEDLFKLKTMGFRGEALASIAAISKLTLLTSLDAQMGTRVEIEGGRLSSVSPAARSRGTTLEVRSLFYNVPARQKFQKSASLTAAEITRCVTLLSLAHPGVAFSLFHREKQIFSLLPETSFLLRAMAILGEDFCRQTYCIESPEIRGFVGSPLQSRSNRTGQYLFINRRPLFSSQISYAVKDGFGTRLAEPRYPTYLLYLELPAEEIDINVHPQKREVRFQKEKELKQKIREEVRRALDKTAQEIAVSPSFFFSTPFEGKVFKEESPLLFKEESEIREEPPSLFEQPLKIIGVFAHYLLLQKENKLCLVDLLAARALIAFEQLTVQRPIEKQGMLFPKTFTLGILEAEALESHLPLLDELGFSIRSLGTNAFIVDAFPSFIEEDALPQLLIECIHEIEGYLTQEKRKQMARALSHLVRRTKKTFAHQEAIALYEELKKYPSQALCPQGMPILIELESHEIKKRLFEK
jgi:DNA mismatch repair protein MutL